MVKITKKKGKNNRFAVVKVNKKGNCVVTAKSGKKTYKFSIHAEPKKTIKNYTGTKTKFTLVNIKKTKKYVVARLRVSNGKNSVLEFDPTYRLEKKVNEKWVKIKQNIDVAGTGVGFSGNNSLTYSVVLSDLYDINDLTKGKYRIGLILNNKMKYVSFKLK